MDGNIPMLAAKLRITILYGLLAATPLLPIAASCAEGVAAEKSLPGPKAGEQAKDFELAALDGETLKLSKAAESGPVVLVFLRGFPGYQCPICTAQAGEFLGKAARFEKAGAKILFVYPGPSKRLQEHAEEFVRGKTLPKNVYLLPDPDYSVTKLYGLRWDAPNETAYPATFVLERDRTIGFAKVSTSHGDRAKAEDVLKALQ